MGAISSKFNELSTGKKAGIVIAVVSLIAVIVVLGVLGGTGLFSSSTSTSGPTPTPRPVSGEALASSFTTKDGKTWQKVYDSMLTPNKYFISFSSVKTSLSPANTISVTKYLYNNGMLPVDNPFRYSIDVPVIGCSADGSRLVLKLDLTNYGGILPFAQGDNIYIFGVNGETNANTTFASNGSISGSRFVYATNKEYPKYILPTNNNVGYIMLGSSNPCTISYADNCNAAPSCNLDNGNLLFASGTYTTGGTVRFLGNYYSNPQGPGTMFYLYMAYKGYKFSWPYAPITPDQAFSQYSGYYNGYMQWYTTLPQTCTQIAPIPSGNFNSGSVDISKGTNTTMKAYVIVITLYGYNICFFIVTDDGSGYSDGDTVTITQGSNTATSTISIGQNCSQQTPMGLTSLIYLSYTTTPQQFKDLIAYVISLDSTINTVALFSGTTVMAPDNYNNPNMYVVFSSTTSDTTSSLSLSNYTENLMNGTNICVCNGIQDQSFVQLFFPNKISQCANQIIFTTNDGSTPFDFVNNADTLSGLPCPVTTC